ncbi:hypothetical protein CEXT_235471, partial [Caerostris extrusa]
MHFLSISGSFYLKTASTLHGSKALNQQRNSKIRENPEFAIQ